MSTGTVQREHRERVRDNNDNSNNNKKKNNVSWGGSWNMVCQLRSVSFWEVKCKRLKALTFFFFFFFFFRFGVPVQFRDI